MTVLPMFSATKSEVDGRTNGRTRWRIKLLVYNCNISSKYNIQEFLIFHTTPM